MNTIIAPVNFSDASNNAALYAAQLCMDKQTDLWLIHVVMIPIGISFTPLPDSMVNEMKSDAEFEMIALKEQLEKVTQGKIKIYHSVEMGSLEHQLEELVKRQKASYVVMGLSRESADRVVFKSNTFVTLKQLEIPLIIVPDDAVYTPWKNITLAYDFPSPPKNLPVGEIQEAVALQNATLQVVYVRKPSEEDPGSDELEGLRNTLAGSTIRFHLMEGKNVEESLLIHLKHNPTDLVLLLPRNHGFFEFHKSDTQKIAGRLSVPVMTIHE